MQQTKTALVTGASTGFGREFARLYASKGYHVILVARHEETLLKVANEIGSERSTVIVQDLSVDMAAQTLYQHILAKGLSVHVLINNAGFGLGRPFAASNFMDIHDMLRTNIEALTELSHLCLPHMLEWRSGNIINLASTAAFQPGPGMAVYYATKAFVLSFTEALHQELRQTGIAVTAVCPGPVATEFSKRAGLGHAKFYRYLNMGITATDVAEQAYKANLANRRVCIPGIANKVLAHMNTVLPNKLILPIVNRINKTR